MKFSRRKFIQTSSVIGTGLLTQNSLALPKFDNQPVSKGPIIISTWKHGLDAGKKSLQLLNDGASLLDAIELGINVVENDPNNHSVGIGGFPDAEGYVTLDALIMDSEKNAGSVAFLEEIKNPISVARLVMENTQHVMLAGSGALKFALDNGFKRENLLTEEMKQKWIEWGNSEKKMKDPVEENHDTIGLIALDANNNIAGGVSTSGWAYKLRGRVGDSPIIGASLYVDNEVGAACATGHGEFAMKTVGSYLVVEKMREGYSPLEACTEAIKRLKYYSIDVEGFQLGYIAINKKGEHSGFSYRKGFNYALVSKDQSIMIDTGSLY